LARYIKSGEELLDQADGVRKRMNDVPEDQEERRASLIRFRIEDEWATRFRKWFITARKGMGSYLQEQYEDVLPALYNGLPPDRGKPRHHIGLENGTLAPNHSGRATRVAGHPGRRTDSPCRYSNGSDDSGEKRALVQQSLRHPPFGLPI
jgi:hypothetical protein